MSLLSSLMFRRFLAVTSCLAVLAFSAASSVAAEKGGLPSLALRTGAHPAFDRVVFDAPLGVTYKITREGSAVTVAFSVAAKIALTPVKLTKAKGFSVVSGGDGFSPLAVRFSVAPTATLKDFMSGTSIVIDVSGPAAPLSPPAAQEQKKPVPPIGPPKTEEKKKPEPTEEKQKEPPQEAVTPPQAPPVSEPTPPLPEEKEDQAPAPTPAPVEPVGEAASPPPLPRTAPPPMDSKMAASLRAIAQEKTPVPVLTFDPKISVGAAVFARAGYITILFDRKLSPPLLMDNAPQRVKAEPLELPRNSGFRVAVPNGVDVRTTRNGTAWELYLVRAGVGPGVSTEFVSQPEFALGSRLLLVTASPPDPVLFTDPVVGDDLLVVPLRETSAFTLPRRLADFQVIPAAQGLVIKPWHEKVLARTVPDGIEISSEGGLKLSPLYDTGAFKVGDKAASLKRLFDFSLWRGRATDGFTQTRQKLMQTVVDVPEEQRLLARMDLARFYFSYGMGAEAAALLEAIRKTLPEIEAKADFLALRGAARILAGQIAEGVKDLSNPVLTDQPEATLWIGIGEALQREWVSAAERFTLVFSILASYPEPFRSRFVVLAVESALAAGKDKEANDWLSYLERSSPSEAVLSAIRYLRGALYSKAGRADRAGKLWRDVAKSKDRLYKTRAELALVDLGVATKSLTPKQAVDRLEGLRFAWRGDDLEFDILRRLGGFYIDAKEFRTGLLVLGQALRLYPASSQASALKAEMSLLFKNIVLTPLGADLSPLEALGIYNDFKSLIPEGEDGNKVRRKLAESLVDIDLLDQAGKLLEEIAKNSTQPEERVKTFTRLAAVRLLAHEAAQALAALDQSQADAGTLSPEGQEERRLLRARALSEMGKYEEALAELPSQESVVVKLLRADIFLRGKQWTAAADVLESLVGAPPLEGAPLSEEKASWLVSAAMAIAQSGDVSRLDKLANTYGRAMAPTQKADLFFLITRPDAAGQTKNLAAAQAKLSEVDMFKGFLDSYRKNETKP